MSAIEGLEARVSGTGRAGIGEEEICGIIVVRVAEVFMEAIVELFGLVKTMPIEEFDQ